MKILNKHIINTATQIVMAILLSVGISACQNEPEPPVDPEPQPCRTVLVYIVATNNLGSGGYDTRDIDEMKEAAKNGHLGDGRLLVYHASYRGAPMLKEITSEGVDTLVTYDNQELSVSIERMRQVWADAKEKAPGNSYGMVLWSHASGWLQDGIEETEETRFYSYGNDRGSKMNITSLAKALEGEGLDFIYFDCCFMGSIETLYQMRNCAEVMIASAAEDPANGMPYHSALQYLFKSDPDYVGAAKANFEYYDSIYHYQYDCPVTMAVVRTKHLEEVASLTKEIYMASAQASPAGYSPQKFALGQCYYFDFEDYMKALAERASVSLDSWQEAYDRLIEYKVATSHIWGEIEITRFGGLSTYIFSSTQDPYFINKNYSQLAWYNDVACHLPLSTQ